MEPDWTTKLATVLDRFERDTVSETGVHRICGGFAAAELTGHDGDYYDIELKWGVQSDCENFVHVENYKLAVNKLDDRPVNDILADIEDS